MSQATPAAARPGDDDFPGGAIRPERTVWTHIRQALQRDRAGVLGLILFALLVITAIFANPISPHDPLQQNLRASRLPPAWTAEGNWDHILGTDNLGRDMLSRIIYGTRVSLTVAFFGVLIAGGLGMTIGLIAGYVGGRVDNAIMSVVNLILALPYLVFVVFIAAVLGRSLINVILIFGLTDIPIFVRITRGETLRMRESVFIEAAESLGVRRFHILVRHILPNLVGPLITLATFEMSGMIFYEAGLGFLGLSVPPSIPSWGNMLATGRQYLTIYPWMVTYPGLAIAVAGLAMNLMGDWLRDLLDPRGRGR